MTANKDGEINSNYGYLIFSKEQHSQFKNVVKELTANPNSRRASMIYTRPSIWTEYNENGKNDFICTNSVSYYIRNSKVHCVVQMRSNDVIFGYRNDWAWQKHVLDHVTHALNLSNPDIIDTFGPILSPGNIYWQVQNIHCYERHFHLIDPNWKKKN